jgi:SAM-dependent methyltransferase
VDLRRSWDAEAEHWVRFARQPGHDHSFWGFGLHVFLDLLPPPGRAVVDLGCGEGRLPRILRERGYRVIGVDGSPGMVRNAAEADPDGLYLVADAARLPLRTGSAGLATAYMTLHDFDDMPRAVREANRVLEPGGRFCFSVVHPINTAGGFPSRQPDAVFEIVGSYLEQRRYRYDSDRDGIRMVFHSFHRPLEAYARALEEAGFLIEKLREPAVSEDRLPEDPGELRWRRVPLFLFGRAIKPG